ncbi:hypothetical protein L1887_27616 [Cichorium endivia]|nr:hypothetical protein L1887_27616 [Cichorium endivia]
MPPSRLSLIPKKPTLILGKNASRDLTPAQVLDLVSSQNYTLIYIRSEEDKDKSGVPRLPSSAKNKMIAISLEEVPSKLKSLVRNTKKLEAEIAAFLFYPSGNKSWES